MSGLKAWVLLWMACLGYPVLCDPPPSCHCYPTHQALLCYWRRVHHRHVDVCLCFFSSVSYKPSTTTLEMQTWALKLNACSLIKWWLFRTSHTLVVLNTNTDFLFHSHKTLQTLEGLGDFRQRNTTLNDLLKDSEKQPEFSSLALE